MARKNFATEMLVTCVLAAAYIVLSLSGQAAAQSIGANSCTSPGSCVDNRGIIGNQTCLGEGACDFNSGIIRDKACLGDDTCAYNSGTIELNTCQGFVACAFNSDQIRLHSCHGEGACSINSAAIDQYSCHGKSACANNSAPIGKKSCLGDDACKNNSKPIGFQSCTREGCVGNAGTIGSWSCRGEGACNYNNETIADHSCNEDLACQGQIEKQVFVTSSVHTGNLDLLSGADRICNFQADLGGLPGDYIAWLSTTVNDAKDRLTPDSGPFVNTNGDMIAIDIDDLTDGVLDNPIAFDEFGQQIADLPLVFTGTRWNGTLGSPDTVCSDWTSASSGQNGLAGDALSVDWTWTGQSPVGAHQVRNCFFPARLYCFQR